MNDSSFLCDLRCVFWSTYQADGHFNTYIWGSFRVQHLMSLLQICRLAAKGAWLCVACRLVFFGRSCKRRSLQPAERATTTRAVPSFFSRWYCFGICPGKCYMSIFLLQHQLRFMMSTISTARSQSVVDGWVGWFVWICK